MIIENLYGYKPTCIIIYAIGGGGDIVSAALLAEKFRDVKTVLVTPVWERFKRDPIPGPIELRELIGVRLYEHIAEPLHRCYVNRVGRIFTPTACAVKSYVDSPLYFIDLYKGEIGVRRGLEEIAKLHGCEAILGVDVGGDVLAHGCEETLWSPLADNIGLSAIVNTHLDATIAIHSPGSDGELPLEFIEEKIAEISRYGGYLGALGIMKHDIPFLERLLSDKDIATEASRIALLAIKGFHGDKKIRNGSRIVKISFIQTLTVFLDAYSLYKLLPIPKIVEGTTSLEEASQRLLDKGVYNEYQLEQDISLYSTSKTSKTPSLEEVIYIREKRRSSLPPCSLG